MARGFNWNRQRDMLRGRTGERLNGDLPAALQRAPRKPAPSKESMRAEVADQVAAFLAKRQTAEGVETPGRARSAPDKTPPWEE